MFIYHFKTNNFAKHFSCYFVSQSAGRGAWPGRDAVVVDVAHVGQRRVRGDAEDAGGGAWADELDLLAGAAAPTRGEPSDGQPTGAIPAGQSGAAGAVHLRAEAAARVPPGHPHLGRFVRVGGAADAAAAAAECGCDRRRRRHGAQHLFVRDRVADARDGAAAAAAAGAARKRRAARPH